MKNLKLNLINFLSIVLFMFSMQVGTAMTDIKSNLLSTIACNDTVQISMGTDCTATVTPDQLLEGNYPDMSIFTVNIIDQDGNSIGDQVTSDNLNYYLVAEVIETTTGNKCWSRINVVDKVAPHLVCEDIYTTCYDKGIYKDSKPGTYTPHNYRFAFNTKNTAADIPDVDTLKYPLEVGNIPGALITDLRIKIDIQHPRVMDLEAFLVSPTGDTVDLFKNLVCGNANMNIELDDDADNSAADLSTACTPNDPTIEGKYKSTELLSTFNSSDPSGTWYLNVIDKNAGETGRLMNVDLLFKQNEGYISFPIPSSASYPITVYGEENTYRVVSGFDYCGETIISYVDSKEDLGCSSNYTGIITREWTAVDESGNTSTCTQKIYIIRTGTAFLEFPHNYDNIDYPALSCKYPNQNTKPSSELCDMVNISYKDDTIHTCSGSYKIIRHWSVSEMCKPDIIEHTQVIAVLDTEGPVMTNPIDTTIEASSLECSANITVTFPDITSDCSNPLLMIKSVGYQFLDKNNDPTTDELLTENLTHNGDEYTLNSVPVGKIEFTYTVTDDCGNTSTKTNIITIIDTSSPTAVCDQHTQIVIGKHGLAKSPAIVFDDGSNDNCTDITLLVRRMNPNCISNDNIFKDSITFCCDDVNTTQMVELQVMDEGGRTNTCMVEVNIVDKIPPVIDCPDDITRECTDDYLNLNLTGDATAYDNCEVINLKHTDDVQITQCNTGYVTRTWTAEDKHGHVAQPCSQTITINDSDHFKFKGGDIRWPSNKTYYECVENFDTSITGNVSYVNEDFCSMVAARFKDDTFKVIDGACLKILRNWEVIDWCNFDADPVGSTWTHTQVIMLQNTVAPTFDSICSTKTFCTFGKCKGLVDYTKTASDDCTLNSDDLFWSYRLDLDNDGTWDIGPINSNNIHQEFNNGTYKVAWTVEDGCGNTNYCEETLIVKDCKKPTPLCITELTTVVMNNNGEVRICAEDFNLGTNCYNCTGSYDNCTSKENLKYSFSKSTSDKCKTYSCDDIPNGVQTQKKLQMWVTDEAGNQDYCTVFINLEDNLGNACKDTGIGSIVYGFVYNPDNTPLKNVELNLQSTEAQKFALTNTDGRFEFNNLSEDDSYKLNSNLNTDYLVGVSTLDIVLIQKHLLGIKKFNKPYMYVAADVNNSKTVTASDILNIRKLILGSQKDFGKNTNAWAFVKDGNDIKNNSHILSTPFDEIVIDKSSFDKNTSLVGIKLGDINSSSDAMIKDELTSRSSKSTSLVSNDISFNKNEIIYAEFNFSDLEDFVGAQFTLNYDTKSLIFDEIELDNDLIKENNFGLSNKDNGTISFSWVKPNNLNNIDNNLFKIKFIAKNSNKLSNTLKLTNDVTSIEAYNNDLETMNIKLKFRDSKIEGLEYALYQNIPNPFSNETTVLFDLPTNQNATLSFYDVTGRKIKVISKEFNKGRNSVNVSFKGNTSSLIYYTLETKSFTQTKKMINLK